jgi:hypothetical protein
MTIKFLRGHSLCFAAIAAHSMLATTAQAQVSLGIVTGPDRSAPLCVEGSTIGARPADECNGSITSGVDPLVPATGVFLGNPDDPTIQLYADGEAYFRGYVQFDGETVLNGPTEINGPLTLNDALTTNSLTNNGSFTNNGSGTFSGRVTAGSGRINGLLTTESLSVNGPIGATSLTLEGFATIKGPLNAQGGANLSGTTQMETAIISNSLTVQAGATVNMGGNIVQNVAAGIASTDAVNVGQLNIVASTASTALANAAAAQTTANTARAEAAAAQGTADTALGNAATAQNTANSAIARGDSLGASTAAALGGGSTYNAATGSVSFPSYTVAGSSYSSVGGALTAVSSQLGLLGNQIGLLDDRLTDFQGQTGRNFERANGGIAAAMALGGTMIVPDSNVSINFNLATYRGEQGFSGVVAVRAAPKIYISGGFAGSTVKGSTGGRVGIALGF